MIKTETEESAQESKTTLDNIIKICQMFDFPTAVFDSDFKCVYSKDNLIELNAEIDTTISDNIKNGSDFFTTIFMIKGVQYCAKVLKMDGYYICGLFSSKELGAMARNTDFFSRVLPSLASVNYNLSSIWGLMHGIKGDDLLAGKMRKSLMRIQSVTQSILEYANVSLKSPNSVRINCYEMISSLVNRCNTLLSKIGRYIEFVGESKTPLYIYADTRHAMSAFISALQNSLLYSSRDYIPVVTLSNSVEDNKSYAVLKIKNDISYYNPRPNESLFINNKIGCGIPIIKCFVEECSGQFEFKTENDTAYTLIKLPTVYVHQQEMPIFECGETAYYETGIPDFLELKINDVIEFFGDTDFV